jgi:hypothetical protein
MFKAILKENKIYCPRCEQCNYQLTNDYKLVEIESQKYVEFVARCLTDNCNEKFYFQSKITMNSTTHYDFNKDKEIEIKDEVTEIKI